MSTNTQAHGAAVPVHLDAVEVSVALAALPLMEANVTGHDEITITTTKAGLWLLITALESHSEILAERINPHTREQDADTLREHADTRAVRKEFCEARREAFDRENDSKARMEVGKS
jgi:hypothetical protein